MRKILVAVLSIGIFACDNAAEVQVDLDSTLNKIENSRTLDSIESKGGRILDSVKSKGGKLIDEAEQEIRERRNDTTNNQ